MKEILKPMDCYSSRMDISFEVAAYCRGRKYCPEAVNLRQTIEKCKEMQIRLERAEAESRFWEDHLKQCLVEVRTKMKREPT